MSSNLMYSPEGSDKNSRCQPRFEPCASRIESMIVNHFFRQILGLSLEIETIASSRVCVVHYAYSSSNVTRRCRINIAFDSTVVNKVQSNQVLRTEI
jgi:hypothetical protein